MHTEFSPNAVATYWKEEEAVNSLFLLCKFLAYLKETERLNLYAAVSTFAFRSSFPCHFEAF
jgi:hypothetical protein